MSDQPSIPLPVLAEPVHHEMMRQAPPLVVAVLQHTDDFEIGSWAVPDEGGDPVEVLIGWRTPPDLDLMGLSIDDDEGQHTTLVDRSGSSITVDASGLRPDPPLVLDSLLRCLALPTPPPTFGIAAWLDLIWLDHLAKTVFLTSRALEIHDLLELHPLEAGIGTLSNPVQLRAEVLQLQRRFRWADLRRTWPGLGDRGPRPPGGARVAESDWFDDGSFARWHLSRLPAADQLLRDLGLLLPCGHMRAIMDGLAGGRPASIDPP